MLFVGPLWCMWPVPSYTEHEIQYGEYDKTVRITTINLKLALIYTVCVTVSNSIVSLAANQPHSYRLALFPLWKSHTLAIFRLLPGPHPYRVYQLRFLRFAPYTWILRRVNRKFMCAICESIVLIYALYEPLGYFFVHRHHFYAVEIVSVIAMFTSGPISIESNRTKFVKQATNISRGVNEAIYL